MWPIVVVLGKFCLGFGGAVIGLLLFVFFLKRLLGWLDQRGFITYTGDVPTWGSLGNAGMEFQKFLQPQYEHVLEQREEEKQKREEDDEGGPDDPVRHLHDGK